MLVSARLSLCALECLLRQAFGSSTFRSNGTATDAFSLGGRHRSGGRTRRGRRRKTNGEDERGRRVGKTKGEVEEKEDEVDGAGSAKRIEPCQFSLVVLFPFDVRST